AQETPKQEFAIDWHSKSNSLEINPQHVSLDIEVDFDNQQIVGSSKWFLKPEEGTEKAIFDTYQLQIDSILYADGSKAPFKIGSHDEILGAALEVDLQEDTEELTIYYKTGEDATALLWLTPEQTFGKEAPYLFTQGESIYTRTWIPSPDGPGYRFSYDAKVKVPEGLLALMSAENPQKKNADGVYTFKMDEKIPAYLIALAVGDIAFKAVDERTGVYAEPSILDKAYNELDGIGQMVHTAEEMYGDYRWGRFDVLILPSGFPMGGMENPRLTFATPTILAGDKSLLNLIAHELAHSWSGNLVTGATWDDFWLNEGFTAYIERRITEAEHGAEYTAMLWDLAERKVDDTVEKIGENSKDTWLKMDLKDRDPDLVFTRIAYDKASALLLLIEQTVGRETWDNFLRKYFDEHAFESMDSERFIEYLNVNLLDENEEWKKTIDIDAWVYGPAKPANYPTVKNTRFEKVDQQVSAFKEGASASALETKNWSTHEWLHFMAELPEEVSLEQMQDFDKVYDFTNTENSEIASAWFIQSIKSEYKTAYPKLEEFLYEVGRGKFLYPLYEELARTEDGKKMGQEIYEEARPNYHPIAQRNIDAILN
ncbi:MAG TPA: M1 family metallopeptidase, partial [Flavobacteriaceae bacterium]|nr:M1 family metallopeptidase [Flavobacteriaceae bacterium]